MTDEEMAENSFNCKKLLYKSSTDKRSYKQAFLAGLKAGRPEWHKVAEDYLLVRDTKIHGGVRI